MSEEEKLELAKELEQYTKEEMIEKYIDELEENHIITDQWYKSSQRINSAIEYLEQELQQEKKDFKETNDYCFELKRELQQKENIIKEVRETLIKSKEYKMAKEMNLTSKMSVLIELLEILDKVEE